MDLKRDIVSDRIAIADYTNLLSSVERSTRQQISKETTEFIFYEQNGPN